MADLTKKQIDFYSIQRITNAVSQFLSDLRNFGGEGITKTPEGEKLDNYCKLHKLIFSKDSSVPTNMDAALKFVDAISAGFNDFFSTYPVVDAKEIPVNAEIFVGTPESRKSSQTHAKCTIPVGTLLLKSSTQNKIAIYKHLLGIRFVMNSQNIELKGLIKQRLSDLEELDSPAIPFSSKMMGLEGSPEGAVVDDIVSSFVSIGETSNGKSFGDMISSPLAIMEMFTKTGMLGKLKDLSQNSGNLDGKKLLHGCIGMLQNLEKKMDAPSTNIFGLGGEKSTPKSEEALETLETPKK